MKNLISANIRFSGNPPLIFGILLGGLGLLFLGFMTAVSPEIILRLLPFPLIFIVVVVAFIGRSNKQVSERFCAVWMTILMSVMALWPSYLLIKAEGLPALDARRIIAGFSFLFATYWVVASRSVPPLLTGNYGPLRRGCWIVTFYAMWRFASCFVSPTPIASLIQVGWEILFYYNLFFVGFMYFGTAGLRDRIHRLMLWLMLIVAAYACVERILGNNPLIQWAPSNEEFKATVRAITASRIREGAFRTQSTFEHPLLLAEFAAMAACYALSFVLWPAKRGGERLLGLIALVASMVAAYLTGSRSAFISVGAGLGTVFLMRMMAARRSTNASGTAMRKWITILAVMAATALATPAVVVLTQGKSRVEASSTHARIIMLQLGLPAIEKAPILGWGPGTGPSIAGIMTGEGLLTMDNYLLSVAIESGIPGFLLFLACLLYPAWAAFSRVAEGAGDSARFLAATTGAMIAMLAMRSILWIPYNLSFVFILGAVALAQCSRPVARNVL